MSLFPDLNPLIHQIKEFNTNQLQTNQLLTELLVAETNNEQHLAQIKTTNSQIKELLKELLIQKPYAQPE